MPVRMHMKQSGSPSGDKDPLKHNSGHPANQRSDPGNRIRVGAKANNRQNASHPRRLRVLTRRVHLPSLISAVQMPISVCPRDRPCSVHGCSTLSTSPLQGGGVRKAKAEGEQCLGASTISSHTQWTRFRPNTSSLCEIPGVRAPKPLKGSVALGKLNGGPLEKVKPRPSAGAPRPTNPCNTQKKCRNISTKGRGGLPARGAEVGVLPHKSNASFTALASSTSSSNFPSEKEPLLGANRPQQAVPDDEDVFASLDAASNLVWTPVDEGERAYLEEHPELPELFRCMLDRMRQLDPPTIGPSNEDGRAAWMLKWLTHVQLHGGDATASGNQNDPCARLTSEQARQPTPCEKQEAASEVGTTRKTSDSDPGLRRRSFAVPTSQDEPSPSSLGVIWTPSPPKETIPRLRSRRPSLVWANPQLSRYREEQEVAISPNAALSSEGELLGADDVELRQCVTPNYSVCTPTPPCDTVCMLVNQPHRRRSVSYSQVVSKGRSPRPSSGLMDQSFFHRLHSCLNQLDKTLAVECEEKPCLAHSVTTTLSASTLGPIHSSNGIDLLLLSKCSNCVDGCDMPDDRALTQANGRCKDETYKERSHSVVNATSPLTSTTTTSTPRRTSGVSHSHSHRCSIDSPAAEPLVVPLRAKLNSGDGDFSPLGVEELAQSSLVSGSSNSPQPAVSMPSGVPSRHRIPVGFLARLPSSPPSPDR